MAQKCLQLLASGYIHAYITFFNSDPSYQTDEFGALLMRLEETPDKYSVLNDISTHFENHPNMALDYRLRALELVRGTAQEPHALARLGSAYQETRESSLAISHFDQAIALCTDWSIDPELFYRKWALLHQAAAEQCAIAGDYDAAIEHHLKSIERSSDPINMYHLGQAYVKTRQIDKAITVS